MNNPPDDLRGNWSAELEGAETWRAFGQNDSWWTAGMAIIADEICARWDDSGKSPEETVPDDTEIEVGLVRAPQPPEDTIDADEIIDLLRNSDHEDYCLECAEDFLGHIPDGAQDELTCMLRNLLGQWLERHNLRPTWFVVDKRWTVTAGEIRAKAKEMQK